MKQPNHDNSANKSSLIFGELGTLVTRLAQNDLELKEAQRIRYEVFCKEFSAREKTKSDIQFEQEKHDLICDHLLVLENNNQKSAKTIGTQRFLVKSACDKHLQFRSQSEFDLEALAAKHPEKRFMELGRSCILEEYRSKRTMELMWQGTWFYAIQNKVDVMTGCASFYAKSSEEIEPALGFLSTLGSNDPQWQVTPSAKNAIPIKQFAHLIKEPKKAIRNLPPLIKGYLRLGAFFSDTVVIDEDFGTIDIAVILPVKNINPRYLRFYGTQATKHRKVD